MSAVVDHVPSRSQYIHGCRCDGCREANTTYQRRRVGGLPGKPRKPRGNTHDRTFQAPDKLIETTRARDAVLTSCPLPTASCLGGAHRRCLLDADLCSCACHLTDRVERPPAGAREVWPCPLCTDDFDTRGERLVHVQRDHPPTVAGGPGSKMPVKAWPG